MKTAPCPYHVSISTDKTKSYQVNTSCESFDNIKEASWFVLPPLMAYYYREQNPFYKPLPKFRENCLGEKTSSMKFLYPNEQSAVFLPKDFNGKKNELILKVAHSNANAKLFWYLNDQYIGTTDEAHVKAILPKKGNYIITVLDNFGNEIQQKMEVKE